MKPTLQQQLNLLHLANGLMHLPEDYDHFTMVSYNNVWDDPYEVTKKRLNHCGTVACAAGHGPLFTEIKGKKDEDWGDYIERVFGIGAKRYRKAWKYLFSGEWTTIDNTPLGAAKRIIRYLEADCVDPRKPKGEDWWRAEK